MYHLSGITLFGPEKQIHLYGSRGTIKYVIAPKEQMFCGRAGDKELRLLEIPPEVEAKKSPDDKRKTFFWGATREGRWLFVVCEDWRQGGTRYLRPITAFEPEEGYEYWRRL